MNTAFLLLAAGVLLLALEVVVPGFIVGALGVLLMLGAIALTYVSHGLGGALGMLAVAAVFVAVTAWLEFVWLPKTRWGRSVILNTAVKGSSSSESDPAAFLGKEGVAVTPLMPSGFVLVDGQRREAYSESGPVAANERVRVIGHGNFRIIVSKL